MKKLIFLLIFLISGCRTTLDKNQYYFIGRNIYDGYEAIDEKEPLIKFANPR